MQVQEAGGGRGYTPARSPLTVRTPV